MEYWVNYNFFRVIAGEEGYDFTEALRAVDLGPRDRARSREYGDTWLRLQRVFDSGDNIIGEFVRINTHELLELFDIDGNSEEIEASLEQGHGVRTLTLFSPTYSVLVTESRRSGVTPKMIFWYFKEIGRRESFEAETVLRPGVFSRIPKNRRIRSFYFKAAPPENPEVYRLRGARILDFLNKTKQYHRDGALIEVKIHLGRGRGGDSLDDKEVISDAHVLVDAYDSAERVEKVIIAGRDEEKDEGFQINLIEDRMRESVTVDVPTGRLLIDERLRALERAFSKQLGNLRRLFG